MTRVPNDMGWAGVRASRLIEMTAQTGIVGDYKGSQAREAMLTLEDWDAMKAQQAADAESGMTV